MSPFRWVFIPVLLTSLTAQTAVRQCRHDDGSILFTQFECPPGSTYEHSEEDGVFSIVRTPELSEAERQALDSLRTELNENRRRRKQTHLRRVRQRQAQQDRDSAQCAEAERELNALDDVRRQGYSAADDRRFDAAEQRWQKIRKATC